MNRSALQFSLRAFFLAGIFCALFCVFCGYAMWFCWDLKNTSTEKSGAAGLQLIRTFEPLNACATKQRCTLKRRKRPAAWSGANYGS